LILKIIILLREGVWRELYSI